MTDERWNLTYHFKTSLLFLTLSITESPATSFKKQFRGKKICKLWEIFSTWIFSTTTDPDGKNIQSFFKATSQEAVIIWGFSSHVKLNHFIPFDFKGTFLFEKDVLRQLRDIICMRLPDNVAYLKHLVQFWVSISLQLKIDKCGPFTTWEGKWQSLSINSNTIQLQNSNLPKG